jgi:isopenicillin N synthase-like dioxygenase
VDQHFKLAQAFFKLPVSEKEKYEIDYKTADYNGWRGNISEPNRNRDNVEIYNLPKFTPDFEGKYAQPPQLKAHIEDIEHSSRTLHYNVVLILLRLFTITLKLPDEDFLINQHTYDKKSEVHFRYIIYHKRTPEECAASGGGLGNGHTDLRSLTLLFWQPVAGLKILGDDGNWTYVSAQSGTITVNYDRTRLLYFARPHNDTVLNPIVGSPVLKEADVKPRFEKPVTMEQWVKAKQTLQLNPEEAAKRWEDGTVEVLAGFRDRKYKE